MRKKITLFVAIVLLFACLATPVYAADDPAPNSLTASPTDTTQSTSRYTYINTAISTLSISSSHVATASNVISCTSDVDKIIISCYIQRYDNGWKTLHSKRTTTYSNRASLTTSCYVYYSGYTYRVRTYYYAYSGDDRECTSCTYNKYH